MAIYHMSAQVIGRSSGRSATAAAAYRSAQRIIDERTGEVHDYTKKSGVDFSEIMLPENCGEWAKNREQLWNATELAEKRKDAQLAREINIAIPAELSREQGRKLVQQYAQENFVSKGMIADVCIHGENTNNPHAHIMLSMREAGPEGFGKKVREWNDKELLEKWRESWARCANQSLMRAEVYEFIDHKSLKDQGLEQAPTVHQGPAATAIQRRGEESQIVQINSDVTEYNKQLEAIAKAQKDIEEISKALAEIQARTPEKREEFAYGFTINTTYNDAQAVFEKRMESEHPEWMDEKRLIQDAKAQRRWEVSFGHYMEEQNKELKTTKAWLNRGEENLQEAKDARKNLRIWDFGDKRVMDQRIMSLSAEVEERRERYNRKYAEIQPYQEVYELHKKHEKAFETSPERKEFLERVAPEIEKRRSAEYQQKREKLAQEMAQKRDSERSRGRGR